jgi:hypothetical protein
MGEAKRKRAKTQPNPPLADQDPLERELGKVGVSMLTFGFLVVRKRASEEEIGKFLDSCWQTVVEYNCLLLAANGDIALNLIEGDQVEVTKLDDKEVDGLHKLRRILESQDAQVNSAG